VPFRVFSLAGAPTTLPRPVTALTGFAARSEFFARSGSALSVQRSRFAVGRSLGCAVFPERTLPETFNDSGASSLRASPPPRAWPEKPSRPAAARRPLSWALLPHSTLGIEGPPCHGLCLPATFRPQGLATLSTTFSLRTPAGLVSPRRRSWDSPFGAFPSQKDSRRFRRAEPTCRSAGRCSRRKDGPERHGSRFLGFGPSESP